MSAESCSFFLFAYSRLKLHSGMDLSGLGCGLESSRLHTEEREREPKGGDGAEQWRGWEKGRGRG